MSYTNFYGQKIKKGALSRQLHIPKTKKIPKKILFEIKSAKVKDKIYFNNKKITVTKLLKKRVNFAINSKKWSRK